MELGVGRGSRGGGGGFGVWRFPCFGVFFFFFFLGRGWFLELKPRTKDGLAIRHALCGTLPAMEPSRGSILELSAQSHVLGREPSGQVKPAEQRDSPKLPMVGPDDVAMKAGFMTCTVFMIRDSGVLFCYVCL